MSLSARSQTLERSTTGSLLLGSRNDVPLGGRQGTVWRTVSSLTVTTTEVLFELSGERDSQPNESGKDAAHPIPH